MTFEELSKDKRKPWFICVGTPLSAGDGVAPRVGDKLKKLGYKVTGTTRRPVDNKTIRNEKSFIYKINKKKYLVIGIDVFINQPEKMEVLLTDNFIPGAGNVVSNLNHKKCCEYGICVNISDKVETFYDFANQNFEDYKNVENNVVELIKKYFKK